MDLSNLKPIGQRVLVRRYALPDQTPGGIYLLGRDYPTMGHIVATGGEFPLSEAAGIEVQWTVGANFDLKPQIGDLLLLDYSDINFVIMPDGKAHAFGDRLIVEKLRDWERRKTSIEVIRQSIVARYAVGRVLSKGKKLSNLCSVGDKIIFDPYLATQAELTGRHVYVIRDSDAIAQLED